MDATEIVVSVTAFTVKVAAWKGPSLSLRRVELDETNFTLDVEMPIEVAVALTTAA